MKKQRVQAFTLASLLVAAGLLNFSGPAQAKEADCTIKGTSKSEVIVGTIYDDVICAGAGKDSIYGFGGNDIIYGESGNDSIYGGEGSDVIDGGPGNDFIDGGTQADQLDGGSGNDRVLGSEGEDELKGAAGNDTLDGGVGRDVINGGLGVDSLSGGDDSDIIRGAAGNDKIQGGSGDDRIDGGAGKDSIRTDAGSDNCKKDPTDVHLDPCALDSEAPVFGENAQVVREVRAGEELNLTWTISDSSGVEASWASIGGPPGWITSWCGFAINADRISGDDKNGVYQIQCRIPDKAPNATYYLFVNARDYLGNSSTYGSQIAFQVVNGSDDINRPEVSDIQSPKDVKPGQQFSISLTAKDETEVLYSYGWFMLNGGGFANSAGLYIPATGDPELITGNNKDGQYRQFFEVPNATPPGQYTLWLSLGDVLGNREFIQTSTVITVKN